jgi:D-amino-acid dehydrogenase
VQSCAIVGAGVVGICCGIALQEKGYKVTLYDPELPGSMTSSGNAGGFGFTDVMPMAAPGLLWKIPGWLFDPCGPLFIRPGNMPSLLPWLIRFQKVSTKKQVDRLSRALTSLLNESQIDTKSLITKTKLSHLFTEKGAITVYKSRQRFEADCLEWKVKADRGMEIVKLGSADIRDMEPDLENANYGWFTPQWCNTTDPYLLTQKLAEYFCRNEGEIVRAQVQGFNRSTDLGDSQTELHNKGSIESMDLNNGEKIVADEFVVAAGIWSKEICRQLGERVLMESERGYNTTLPNPGVKLERQVIFGEEKFVITNIRSGLRIGGAAEFSGLLAKPNYQRSERLVEIARRYLPALDDTGGEKWMGHRPSTPDSIPIIGPSEKFLNLNYAFGHGHYGLTMAATTGKLIASSISNEKCDVDLSPFSIRRFN